MRINNSFSISLIFYKYVRDSLVPKVYHEIYGKGKGEYRFVWLCFIIDIITRNSLNAHVITFMAGNSFL